MRGDGARSGEVGCGWTYGGQGNSLMEVTVVGVVEMVEGHGDDSNGSGGDGGRGSRLWG